MVVKDVYLVVVMSAPFAGPATARLVLLFIHDRRHFVISAKIIKTLTF